MVLTMCCACCVRTVSGGLSAAVRSALLSRMADGGSLLLSPHLPFPGAGRVVRDASGVFNFIQELGEPCVVCEPVPVETQ